MHLDCTPGERTTLTTRAANRVRLHEIVAVSRIETETERAVLVAGCLGPLRRSSAQLVHSLPDIQPRRAFNEAVPSGARRISVVLCVSVCLSQIPASCRRLCVATTQAHCR